MKVEVTIGTTYCGCPSESFIIECDSMEDFEQNHEISTEIINAICNGETPHYFMEWDAVEDDEDEEEYDDDDDYR